MQVTYHGESTEINYIDVGQIREIEKLGGRFHEHTMLEAIAAMNISEGAFIDIGAHVGNHSIFFAKYCGRQVTAFEASPITFDTLVSNIAANHLHGRVVCYNRAIGKAHGTVGIAHNHERPGQSKIVKGGTDITISPLDASRMPLTALIKIDVEGGEHDVLRGCLDVINRDLPELFIETFHRPERLLRSLPKGYRLIKRYNNAPTFHFSTKFTR